ncbi:hypothetical protein EDD85DRAFT_800788 [Armillaria nabsnona]|nr:hypothetical protein EDD85DRAFT_800788 [Armillaria nabsnona]
MSSWKAYNDGLVLGVQEWGVNIIIQDRDNKLRVWLRVEELLGTGRPAALSESPVPVPRYSMDVDSENYFRGCPYRQTAAQQAYHLRIKTAPEFSRIFRGRYLVPTIFQSSPYCDREARKQRPHPFHGRARESGHWYYDHPRNGAVMIRDDDRVRAIGGWGRTNSSLFHKNHSSP